MHNTLTKLRYMANQQPALLLPADQATALEAAQQMEHLQKIIVEAQWLLSQALPNERLMRDSNEWKTRQMRWMLGVS